MDKAIESFKYDSNQKIEYEPEKISGKEKINKKNKEKLKNMWPGQVYRTADHNGKPRNRKTSQKFQLCYYTLNSIIEISDFFFLVTCF